jgi:hypothetical protein
MIYVGSFPKVLFRGLRRGIRLRVEPLAGVPLRERHVGVVFEVLILWPALDFDPCCLGAHKTVHVLWRCGQRGVDGAGVRVDELGPGRIPEPQRTSAARTEVALALLGYTPSP